ncbi:hypothetical protein [Paenibacillus sp. FSL H3-0333]|uniref:hypothetical protein n=1 Tax=Paenibacillus sp. FSL H3-0333 TaxID=2921373 RepID=UPI0030F6ABF3
MNTNSSAQIRECEQIVQQLMAQTQQGTQNYQQLLQQEQQDAAKLQELSQHNSKAIQMIQQALQGHQTAMQQLQQISQSVRSMEQFPQTSGFNTHTSIPSFNSGNQIGLMHSMGQNQPMGQSHNTGMGGYNSSFSPSFTSNSQPVNSLHSPINAGINHQPMHTPMQAPMSAGSSYNAPMNQGRSFQ